MPLVEQYEVKFRKSGDKLTAEEIRACESELGLRFPQPYFNFLLEQNGGSPSPGYLASPGDATKIQKFLSIAPMGLVDTCKDQRHKHGLPEQYVSIAKFEGTDHFLVLDCSPANAGALFGWSDLEHGFQYKVEEYENTPELPFKFDQLLSLFGPAKNREDRIGMFCRLYWASSDPNQGSKLAKKFVEAGYDINYVLPPYNHPIFGALRSEEYDVVETLIALGTRLDHVDRLHPELNIVDQLSNGFNKWTGMLEITKQNKYATGIGMAKRKLTKLKSALAAIVRLKE